MIETIMFAMPSITNIGGLLILIYFVFSVIGVYHFHGVIHGKYINEFSGFENFGLALLTLFRASMGEDWWNIMMDVSKSPPGCEHEIDCGSGIFI